VHGPGYRAIYDLARPDASLWVAATGQSGHPQSRHYDDLTHDWRAGRYLRMSMAPEDYRDGAVGILHLAPAKP
jgi:penicillin amidase